MRRRRPGSLAACFCLMTSELQLCDTLGLEVPTSLGRAEV